MFRSVRPDFTQTRGHPRDQWIKGFQRYFDQTDFTQNLGLRRVQCKACRGVSIGPDFTQNSGLRREQCKTFRDVSIRREQCLAFRDVSMFQLVQSHAIGGTFCSFPGWEELFQWSLAASQNGPTVHVFRHSTAHTPISNFEQIKVRPCRIVTSYTL